MRLTKIIVLGIISCFLLSSNHQFNNPFIEVSKKANPCVVSIISEKEVVQKQFNPFFNDPFFEDFFPDFKQKGESLGSGVIIDKEGFIITNNHVIDGADKIRVILYNKNEYEASVIGIDPLSDLAIIQIEADEALSTVKMGNSDKLSVGEWVIAIGSPFGLHLNHTVTAGIVSATGRSNVMSKLTYEDFIQHDAAINPGNSGGALLNLDGELVGINTAIATDGYSRSNAGVGFAIPINQAKRVVEDLLEDGTVSRGWLGVRIQYVTKEIADVEKLDKPRGALVASVAENSPSDKAGIKAGDIILEFNGVPIKEMKELPKIVAQTEVGKNVEVKVWRNGKEILKKIKLGRLETSEDFKAKKPKETKDTEIESLKINVRPIEERDIEERGLTKNTKGLVITKISNDSPINYLEAGNIIIEAQKKTIRTIGDLEIAVKAALKSSEKTLLLVIYNTIMEQKE